jgi:phthalate 4,5-dioxygenase oxygenase subunit
MDVEGNVLEPPAEPPGSNFKDRIKDRAYTTREVAGVVWTYMPPPGQDTSFPRIRVDPGTQTSTQSLQSTF